MDEDIEDFESLCASIGFVVVNWALAEQSLDMCISVIYKQCGGNTLATQLPHAFQQKIRFVRKSLAQLEPIKSYADQLNPILDRMVDLSKRRHDLVHGVVVSITLVNGVFPIDKLDYTAQDHVLRQISFDPQEFPQLAEDLLALGRDIAQFGKTLAERFPS